MPGALKAGRACSAKVESNKDGNGGYRILQGRDQGRLVKRLNSVRVRSWASEGEQRREAHTIMTDENGG